MKEILRDIREIIGLFICITGVGGMLYAPIYWGIESRLHTQDKLSYDEERDDDQVKLHRHSK